MPRTNVVRVFPAGAICQLGRQAIDADRDGAQLDAGDVGDARKKGPPRRAAKPLDARQGRRTPYGSSREDLPMVVLKINPVEVFSPREDLPLVVLKINPVEVFPPGRSPAPAGPYGSSREDLPLVVLKINPVGGFRKLKLTP